MTERHDRQVEKAVAELRALWGHKDPELAHIRADEILLELLRELGHDSVSEAFEGVTRWFA